MVYSNDTIFYIYNFFEFIKPNWMIEFLELLKIVFNNTLFIFFVK